MITQICEIIIQELGPTGLLILVVGYFAQKAFSRLERTLKTINHELASLIKIAQDKLDLLKEQKHHG